MMIKELTESEVVDLVDIEDRVIGHATLDECYSKGLLHRAVTIYCWNGQDEVLLQKRSHTDSWFPGFWTASCTGHVRLGEDWQMASRRELQEELGLHVEEVHLLFKYNVPLVRYGDLIENEIMYVIESNIGKSGISIDPSEVEEVRFFERQELKSFFETRTDVITPDAVESFRRYSKLKKIR